MPRGIGAIGPEIKEEMPDSFRILKRIRKSFFVSLKVCFWDVLLKPTWIIRRVIVHGSDGRAT